VVRGSNRMFSVTGIRHDLALHSLLLRCFNPLKVQKKNTPSRDLCIYEHPREFAMAFCRGPLAVSFLEVYVVFSYQDWPIPVINEK